MLSSRSIVKVVDNSGALYARCIKPFGGWHKRFSFIGDLMIVSIQKLRLIRKVKRGEIYYALVIRTKNPISNKEGGFTQFKKNVVILLNSSKKLLGNRFFGPVSRNLRKKKFLKVLLITKYKMY